MIINITQHCTLACEHCMQNASPNRKEFMSHEMFRKCLDFAKKNNAFMIGLSGGEPTTHPLFFEFLQETADNGFYVTIISNGSFLSDNAFTQRLAEIVSYYISSICVQVTSIKGLYANYDEIHSKQCQENLSLLANCCMVYEHYDFNELSIKPFGRAAAGKYYRIAEERFKHLYPSCANSGLIVAQLPDKIRQMGICKVMEQQKRFCLPIINWKGDIRMGESEQCKVVANVEEPFNDIIEKIIAFRPCGGCASFKWHFSTPTSDRDKFYYGMLYGKQSC